MTVVKALCPCGYGQSLHGHGLLHDHRRRGCQRKLLPYTLPKRLTEPTKLERDKTQLTCAIELTKLELGLMIG